MSSSRGHRDGAAPGGVQSVATALDLLDCLAAERELGVAELGRRLGIAKSSAHRVPPSPSRWAGPI